MEYTSSHSKPPPSRRRSGYEPSDTETEWQESPWHEGPLTSNRPKTPTGPSRTISPLNSSRRHSSREDAASIGSSKVPRASPIARRHSRSPFKGASVGNNERKSVSPYKGRIEDLNYENDGLSNFLHKRSQRTPPKFRSSVQNDSYSQFEVSRGSERSKNNRNRSISAPRPRSRESHELITVPSTHTMDQVPFSLTNNNATARDPSPNKMHDSAGNDKLPKSLAYNAYSYMSTDISQGDIFFSRDCTVQQKVSVGYNGDKACDKEMKVVSESSVAHNENRGFGGSGQVPKAVSISTVLSQTNTSSNPSLSRLSSSKTNTSSNFHRGRLGSDSAKYSDSSGKVSIGFVKFTLNRQKGQKDIWLSCIKRGPCRRPKSPENRAVDEASFINKAFVVEKLRPFWAEKYRPRTLNGFICHRLQVQQLKQLVSHDGCPHILFKGPPGSGKKSLCMALLQEIFGDSSLKVTHDLRRFRIQESQPAQIVVPLTSSPHHVELNLRSQVKNARHALMAIAKEIAGNHTEALDDPSFKMDYKVIVLYDVDKATENVQHLIKWVMDCYADACKIILCCEDEADLLEPVKSRCKVVTVDAPGVDEITDILIHIARREKFELSGRFAAAIATKSKQNLREAIMALEACKAHKYPFVDEQPIPFGWEEVLIELAADILTDPSPERLTLTRGKFQKLLMEFVHPKLILQKLVEQFLKGIEAGIKRELYYWHAYYDKRLPTGASALLKLEEFVAKFMSIHRKNFPGSLYG
nr:unnamed protein product [Ananas comosus var. bracteatus]